MFPPVILITFIAVLIYLGDGLVHVVNEDQKILHRMLRSYDHRVRPPGENTSMSGTGGPVNVKVNIMIRMLSKIDDVNMEYSMQITFREMWTDPRLAYAAEWDLEEKLPEFVVLPSGSDIWMPDTFFPTEKQGHRHMIDKPNVLVRIHSDGRVLYSVRLSLVLSCPMYLHYYPMDVQTCNLDLISYAYTTKDIEYAWITDRQPVQILGGLNSSLPSFALSNVTTSECTSTTNTGTYGCLRMQLTLSRQFSYYLLQLYMPSSMLVIVSWLSFWLDRKAAPARVALGITTLLTMATQQSGINAKLPPVSYTKAIDVWIGACLTFIFGALLEYAFVSYLDNHSKGKKGATAGAKETTSPTKQRRSPLSARRLLKCVVFNNRRLMRTAARTNVGGGSPLPVKKTPPSPLDSINPSLALLHSSPIAANVINNVRPFPELPPLCTCPSAQRPLLADGEEVWTVRDDSMPPLEATEQFLHPLGAPPPRFDYPTPLQMLEVTEPWRVKVLRAIKSAFKVPKERPKRIDFLSRFFFPCGFIIFNILYWLKMYLR